MTLLDDNQLFLKVFTYDTNYFSIPLQTKYLSVCVCSFIPLSIYIPYKHISSKPLNEFQ